VRYINLSRMAFLSYFGKTVNFVDELQHGWNHSRPPTLHLLHFSYALSYTRQKPHASACSLSLITFWKIDQHQRAQQFLRQLCIYCNSTKSREWRENEMRIEYFLFCLISFLLLSNPFVCICILYWLDLNAIQKRNNAIGNFFRSTGIPINRLIARLIVD
jgi:hypothetical protein